MKRETKTPPPYTNRFKTVPDENFYRCQGLTKQGVQCRRGAMLGEHFCDQHKDQDTK